MDLQAGGGVTNGSVSDRAAVIQGYESGVHILGAATPVSNFGTIEGAAQVGVYLANGGMVTNGAATDPAARLAGYVAGVQIKGAAGTVTNFGTIEGLGAATGLWGVELYDGGSVTNGSGGDHAALIEGYGGVVVIAAAGTVRNFGTVRATGGMLNYGVDLAAGGSLTNGAVNDTSALIEGYSGVVFGAAGSGTNFGVIRGTGPSGGQGAFLQNSDRLVNGAANDKAAVIEGYVGALLEQGSSLTNFGTVTGSSGVAVKCADAAESLIVEAGSVFVGSINGGGGTLELAGGTGTLTGLLAGGSVTVSGSMATTTFSNFATVKIDGGASFALAGSGGTIAAGQSLIDAGGLSGTGTLALTGGAATFNAGASLTIANVTLSGASKATVNTNLTYAGKWTQSAGTLSVGGGATMSFIGAADSFAGTVANAGVVGIVGVTATIGAGGLTLTGAGHGVMTDSALSEITGATAGSVLTVGQALNGAGKLGAGKLILTVQATGVIASVGANALIIDTGAATIANAGIIEAVGAGGATVVSAVNNTGRLEAFTGTLTIEGAVTGAGFGEVVNGTLKIASTSTFNQNVTFTSGATGTLELAHGQTYSGTISGFSKTGTTRLDLDDINAAGAAASWSKATGNLTVKDATHTATIHLSGDYTGSAFLVVDDGHGHALIHDPAKIPGGAPLPPRIRPLPLHPFIAAAASFGAPAAGMVTTFADTWRWTPPILASPRVQIA